MNVLPWDWQRLDSCPSSSTELRRRIADGKACAFTVLVAERQTAGRGRLDRAWISPPGNLALSLAWPLGNMAARPYRLNLAAGLAVARFVTDTAGVQASLKWPNDVLVRGRKLAGILSETAEVSGLAVIGIGLNLNTTASDFPVELRGSLTTLRDETGREWNIGDFARGLVGLVGETLALLNERGLKALHDEIHGLLVFRGETVEIVEPGEPPYRARIEGLDAEGFLTVVLPDGEVRTVVAGDVRAL